MKMEELVKEAWKALRKQAKKYKLPQDKDSLVDVIESSKLSKNEKQFHRDPDVIWNLAYLQGAADAYDVTLMGLLDEAL